MQALGPITQLYISIDAATKEKLKQIDLPLFKDYWERYLKCMEVIKNKKQRTVYRLTLILGENMDEIDEYDHSSVLLTFFMEFSLLPGGRLSHKRSTRCFLSLSRSLRGKKEWVGGCIDPRIEPILLKLLRIRSAGMSSW